MIGGRVDAMDEILRISNEQTRIVLGEEQNVAAHRINNTFERREVSDVMRIGFEQRGDAVFAHQHLRAFHPFPAHSIGIESLLPIRRFGTERQLSCVVGHAHLP